jgi:hypothetical protein
VYLNIYALTTFYKFSSEIRRVSGLAVPRGRRLLTPMEKEGKYNG